jgi:hypothetical protein
MKNGSHLAVANPRHHVLPFLQRRGPPAGLADNQGDRGARVMKEVFSEMSSNDIATLVFLVVLGLLFLIGFVRQDNRYALKKLGELAVAVWCFGILAAAAWCLVGAWHYLKDITRAECTQAMMFSPFSLGDARYP